MSSWTARAGHTNKMGATVNEAGVNFCMFAHHAQHVYLCLYDHSGHSEVARIALFKGEAGLWHVQIDGIRKGQLYGYRVAGEFAPALGHLHNVNKFLVDPYSYALHGEYETSGRHQVMDEMGKMCPLDNAHLMPKSVVVEHTIYHGHRPNISWADTVLYECHVKGWSARHGEIEHDQRGTYSALGNEAFISHVKALGVTAVELMPVHEFISEPFLAPLQLSNYWGYNTLSFFAPHRAYSSSEQATGAINEFKAMVSSLHEHGVEVIIDVVYNHTCEGALHGPSCHFRGIDNASYYRLDKQGHYINDTGCGNTVAIEKPHVLRLVLDSLRYWYEVMGVDGFRFDLGAILGRDKHGFNARHAFFQCIAQDPVLSKAKLIAEPWDIGPGGYQLGGFSAPWREWNDQYRDVVRRFWRGDNDMLGVLAKRLHGSADIFKSRAPSSTINFVVSHDGYTLADLVSYEQKRNEANGEHNRDGHNANFSFNFGVEGVTSDPEVKSLRLKAQKNLLLSLLLSKGVPMLSAGCEMAHSQGGNNNAYCQDNAISWLSWNDVSTYHPLSLFISDLQRIRNAFSIFKYDQYVHDDDPRFDLGWYRPNGDPMQSGDWHDAKLHTLIHTIVDKHANKYVCLVLHRAQHEQVISLPKLEQPPFNQWHLLLSSDDTVNTHADNAQTHFETSEEITLTPCSSWVFSNVQWHQVTG
ncbi:glycogen debranching protein GlgX [Pseudoalteromonas sp. YIC-656]|uniref:glycogen debranching protein GlgX n=1 Tax=Pseudoalteromonas pernae TaxID=3118054 RepID=UPI003242F1D6